MKTVNQKNKMLGEKRSVIREIFEYAKARSAEIGGENVFDFSIGNPSVPAPAEVNETIRALTENMPSVALHGYTSAQGDFSVRKTIADYINLRFQTKLTADNLYMTCGAAASLTICMHALTVAGEEVVTFAPYFTEYKVFAEGAGCTLKVVPPDEKLLPDFAAFEAAITPKTRIVLYNSPNNPSGVVYDEATVKHIAEILERKQQEYGTEIYLIADEPYRELVYDAKTKVPYVMNYYQNSLVCYSYSKALSLPGERIGYIAVNPDMVGWKEVYAAVCGAGRSLGYVCAPALMQRVVAACVDKTSDISVYKANRDLFYNALTSYGFEVVYPDGAFYLFMKSPEKDAYAFYERAKKYELLLVPADDFGVNGYVRLAYCVAPDTIKRALPAFEKLAKEYNL
ncbi:MAG: pyridoxal phosphate-dependent aminotransferase [Clostridia bacterium]|nr:pyridoxal phosphate-dependent aminotransferase [Clostridia bacterium]